MLMLLHAGMCCFRIRGILFQSEVVVKSFSRVLFFCCKCKTKLQGIRQTLWWGTSRWIILSLKRKVLKSLLYNYSAKYLLWVNSSETWLIRHLGGLDVAIVWSEKNAWILKEIIKWEFTWTQAQRWILAECWTLYIFCRWQLQPEQCLPGSSLGGGTELLPKKIVVNFFFFDKEEGSL